MTQGNPFARNYQEPARTTPPGQVDEFELMRRRLKQRGATTGEERQRELSRQFASMGNLPSGAAIKARQQAATASERATEEAMQNVNIAEADILRQEREALAGRNLARETLSKELGSRETISREQLASSERISEAQIASTEKISADQLAWAERERTLIEAGMDSRLASQLAQNKDLFNIEMALKERGQDFLESSTNKEFDLNKSISALNAVNLLTQTGFGREEVAGIFQTLGLPHAEFLSDYFVNKRLPGDPRPGQLPGIANDWNPMEEQQPVGSIIKRGGQIFRKVGDGSWQPVELEFQSDKNERTGAPRFGLTQQQPRTPLLSRSPFAARAERMRRR